MIRFFILLSLLFVLFGNDLDAKKYTRQSDSLELVKFYQQTGGDNWTKNNGWRDGSLPVWKWFGILSEEVIKGIDTMVIVTDIDLADNNLSGALPELVMPDLFGLFVNSNKLSGLIPAYKNGKFAWMDVSKNKFMIEDFMPNIDFFHTLESFVYEAQDSSFKLTVTYNANSIFFDLPYKCANCTYNWYINGKREYQRSKDTMSNNVFFAQYKAEVLHPQLPLLKFNSNEFQILTEAISPADSAKDIDKPVLKWKEVEVADKYYIFSIFNSASSSIERYDTSYKATFSYPVEIDLNNLTIFWLVAPARGAEVGTFTKARSFTTKFVKEYTDPADSLELVRFYNKSGGENWTKKTNWLSDKPVWQWYGVTTKSTRVGEQFVHSVIKLDLSFNKVTINEIDLDLPYLEELNLGINNSIVKFNNEKVNLPNLKKVYLNNNEFNDDITIFNLFQNLVELNINSAKIKSLNGLKLDSLKNLYANKNEIADNVIDIITPNLINISLSENKINGSLTLPYLPSLKYLILSNNQIEGLENIELSSVEFFDLSTNKITNFGQLSALSNMKMLKKLILNNNQIEDEIINLKSSTVDSLILYNNKVFGKVDLQNMPKLKYLLASRNFFKDTFLLMNAPNLAYLDLTLNKFSHVNDLYNFTNLKTLLLSNNEIVSFFNCKLPALRTLSIANNKISGEVPNFVIDNPSLMFGSLIINGNYFTYEDIRTNYLENKKVFSFTYAEQKITYKYMAERVGTEYHLEPIYDGIGDKFEWISNNKVLGEAREFVVDKPLDSYKCKISYSKIPNLSYFTDTFNPLPLKLYPTKDAENVEMQPTFRWSKLDYATKYMVIVSETPTLYSGFAFETKDTFGILSTILEPNKQYYWTLVVYIDNLYSSFNNDPWVFKTINEKVSFNKNDSLALVDFYNKTNGKNWKNQYNWLTDTTAKSWGGLTTRINENDEKYEYYVTGINLYNNNLEGEIDRIDLDSLKIISLNNNKLSGSIPKFKSNVISQIHLSGNKFEDGLENTFKNSVIDVFVDKNEISQELPEVWGDKLQYLVLQNNKISGTFPEINAPSIRYFDIGFNNLSEILAIIKHDSIRTIRANNNLIKGEFPNFDTPLLDTLILNDNQLEGEITLIEIPRIYRIDLKNNNLSGNIPLFNTPKLGQFDITNNKFRGQIPNKIAPLIRGFYVSNNKFSFDDISFSYIDYFSNTYIYYPQDTLFELIPIKDGNNYYLEVKTDEHLQKSYTWFRNDTIIEGAKSKILIINDLDAVYHCKIGHKTLDKLFINTIKSSYKALTSVEDEVFSGDMVISPNPAGEYIMINCGSIGACSNDNGASPIASIEIYDVMGVKIQTTSSASQPPHFDKLSASLQEGNLRIDVSFLTPGVYFIKIGYRVEKFVKY